MKTILNLLFSLLLGGGAALANVAPTVTVKSAAMRPGTTLMDIVYNITDPDDATVKVRALAFVDGVRSFSNVIRPVTWAEGTEAKLGDAIPTGVDHTLTWDVAADWNIDLGNIKVEILARDGRGLLPLDWITIPAAGGKPAVTISKNVPTASQVLDALFWLYADGDPELVLENGSLKGTAESGSFVSELLVSGSSLSSDLPVLYLYKRLNVSAASFAEQDTAILARAGLAARMAWPAANRPWDENGLGVDPNAVASQIVGARWVKLTYADGSITMGNRFDNRMWFYNVYSIPQMSGSAAIAYCNNLSYGGYDDWVLPDAYQLASMAPHMSWFPNAPSGPTNPWPWYISSTWYTHNYTGIKLPENPGWSNMDGGYVWPMRNVE